MQANSKNMHHLKQTMASLVVLSMKTRNAHWNVVGPDFHSMHAFFESLYEAIEPDIDEVAERIRALGSPAPGHLAECVATSTVKERLGTLQSSEALLAELLADYETVVAHLRHSLRASDDADDPTTSDLFSDLLAKFEKAAWMIRSHQSPSDSCSSGTCSVASHKSDSSEPSSYSG